ncbi:DNA mismatch repair protein muts2, putative [Ricinus communis]|uniref:DNA mismatch repair protein muts2, putative n=1 Tax=Ricinus communis TaxID=3988 RepID=B9S0T6_RICCO|nr:DNA mismatch repair protein muts2, putative [Ricinus communis]
MKIICCCSDSGAGSILEPLTAVPLNDELQRARESVAKAEADVLLMLTEKINARATYSLSFGGACPDLYLPEDMDGLFTAEASEMRALKGSNPLERKWILYMRKAYHPLLLQQHRQNLQKAQKDAKKATSQKLQGDNGMSRGETDLDSSSSEIKVSALEQAHPVPVDFLIAQNSRVLVITGPNTGGKTICLKTVGLAAMMAKSGLYVLCSESVQLPWFDYILADIGDEQSLSQSLSTFSGHLKQISDIRSQSTNRSLVLLDEVGAGTNPLEGAALGMSLLESFAEDGALLTIATTHHSELKSLKYSNSAFENACMEFDEVNLKPTYKIIWGVPGRSNAINISEKLGLPDRVINIARELYGAASAEINEVIIDMERFKQEVQELLYEAQHQIRLSKDLHEALLLARRKIMEHGSSQRYKMMQEIYEIAAMARSLLHKKVRQHRAYITSKPSHAPAAKTHSLRSDQLTTVDSGGHSESTPIGTKTQSSGSSKPN